MDSASGISGSACGSRHNRPRVFCVVCGSCSEHLILRKSGLKCASCVGKSSNKHYAKLQKRQAKKLFSNAFPAQSPTAGLDTASSVQPGDCSQTNRLFSSASSSLPPAVEDYSGTAGVSTERSSTLHPIEEYISGTSVYRAVMEQACYSGENDRSGGEGGSGDRQTLMSGADGVTRSTSDALSKAHQENTASGSHTNVSSSAAAGDNAGDMRRTSPPLMTQRQESGDAQCSDPGSAKSGRDGVGKTPLCRDSSLIPPTPILHKVTEKESNNQAPARCYKTAPSRLPPRHGPRGTKGTPRLPPSAVDVSRVSAAHTVSAKSNGKATGTSSLNGATASPPSSAIKAVSAAARCVEGQDLMPESGNSVLRDATLPPAEPAAGQHHSHPSTPRGDERTTPLAASLSQNPTHPPQVLRASRQSPTTFPDASLGLPAPRAGSCNTSITSSTMERGPASRLPLLHSHADSNAGTQVQRDSQGGTRRLSAAPSTVSTLPNTSVRPVDAPGAAGAGAPSLSRMPNSSGATAAALDNCHSVGSSSRCRHNKRGSRGGSSGDSESSSSSLSDDASAIDSSLPSVVSSATPEAVIGEDGAATSGTGTKKALHGGTNALDVGTKKRTRQVPKSVDSTMEKKGAGGSAGHGLATTPLSGYIDALHITVESVQPPLLNGPETTTSAPCGGDELPQAATSYNDESSTTTGDTHSRCDSIRSGSFRTNDGYQRQVYVVGQSGNFKVTRHIRQCSGSSDVLAGRSSAAVASSASGTLTATRLRGRQQHGSSGDTMGTGAVEVKRISYRIIVKNRCSGEVLLTQERRLYTQIIPALERVKAIAGGELPAVPVKRLPSLRFATEVFTEERRAEVEAFLQAVALSPFYVRHPEVVKLLGLELYVTDAGAAAATGAAAAKGSRGNGADAHRPSKSPRAMHTKSSPSMGVGADIEVTPLARRGAACDSKYLSRHSRDGEAGVRAAAATGRGEAGTGCLTVDALNAYCSSTMGGGGGDTADSRNFCRSQSCSSVQTSCSSVVRRRKLDEVTMEDLEHIQLGNLIGRGTFGSVYLGLVQTQRGSLMVAVKVMKVGEAVAPSEMESLQRELDVLCAARHKNIIRFLGSSLNTTTRDLRVFTEYVECGTIRSLVDRFGALTMLAIQQYMQQILSGLQYLHSLSIAHRDIKGENILVTKNGRIKLSDFGSSTGAPCKVVAAAESPSKVGSGGSADSAANGGLPVGSPQYMAPEVIHGTVKSFAAVDIWSLGCVGIEMMDRPIWRESPSTNPFVFLYRISRCGTPPHGLPTDDELAALKAEGKKTECEGFSVYLEFLRSCLRVDPEQRPSAAELLKHPFMTYPYSKHLRWMPPMPATAKPSALKSS
ncbi:protein kinase, putative [Leishmania donovani]|uniref:Protein kinase, putative n=1 Tax=Leishmania donovani TaxID=5661 RepID=E9B995_LEIDO|nr:protein kinase, putative [Leishmania donovani]CBZ31818.1 protein kinase, putative [Leishmania donovani]